MLFENHLTQMVPLIPLTINNKIL